MEICTDLEKAVKKLTMPVVILCSDNRGDERNRDSKKG